MVGCVPASLITGSELPIVIFGGAMLAVFIGSAISEWWTGTGSFGGRDRYTDHNGYPTANSAEAWDLAEEAEREALARRA
jgi:hypothetical protein